MFEYQTQEFPGGVPVDVLAWLNRNGEAGWEAFSLESTPTGYRVWLKRQRSNIIGGLDYSQGKVATQA